MYPPCRRRTNGDSFYEYLLKMYVLWGDVQYWDMFMQCYVSIQVRQRWRSLLSSVCFPGLSRGTGAASQTRANGLRQSQSTFTVL